MFNCKALPFAACPSCLALRAFAALPYEVEAFVTEPFSHRWHQRMDGVNIAAFADRR